MTTYLSTKLRQQIEQDAGHRCGYCLSDETLTGIQFILRLSWSAKFILRLSWSAKFILRLSWSAKFILRFYFLDITVLYSIGKRYSLSQTVIDTICLQPWR